MGIIGNIIWFLFGGAFTGFSWLITGLFWSFTIIGIPIGKQCFKIAILCCLPFGKEVYHTEGTISFLMNILWISTSGWVLAVQSVTIGMLYCFTIIGIPFGKQYFKIARLALAPFGSFVR